jgi:hypothetical protein
VQVLSPGRLSQPSLFFAGKARSLPQRGASERCFNGRGSGLFGKHHTMLDRLAKDKQSSLFGPFVSLEKIVTCSDTQHNDTQHKGLIYDALYNETNHNGIECRYAERHFLLLC